MPAPKELIDAFSNPVSAAAHFMQQGLSQPFASGVRVNLMGPDGEHRQIRHSAETLCAARDSLRAMQQMQGGEAVTQPNAQPVAHAKRDHTVQIG